MGGIFEKKPLVSVVMPAYNAERFVEAAIRSVQSQTVADWELLVLDDGSSDGTCAIAACLAQEDPRIRLLPNGENLGVARTRNRGFDLSRGQFVALLDSDDVWHPEKLEKQLARLAAGGDFCYCSYAIIGKNGEKARSDFLVPETVDFEKLLRQNIIGCSTVLLRRELTGKYRFTTQFFHEDYVLWLQLLQSGCRAVGCPEVLADWRYIADSRSFDKGKSARNRRDFYRKYLKLSLLKSAWVFAAYALTGVRKYMKGKKT